jgi:hypothetical protein
MITATLEIMISDINYFEIRVGNLNARFMLFRIQKAFHGQPGARPGAPDQVDHGPETAQGPCPPVDTGEREQTVPSLAPF